MWFDGIRQPNTIYAASVSRGKDSTAMLRAIQLMGWPLDVVYACDIWFDDDTPAELPPMVDFKEHWDERCKEEFGLPVVRLCATCTEDRKNAPPWPVENFQQPLVVGGVQMHIHRLVLQSSVFKATRMPPKRIPKH